MADEKKKQPMAPAAPVPAKPVDAESIAAELAAAMAPPLPVVERVDAPDGCTVRLRYDDPALHAARVSADVEALRALPGHELLGSSQREERAHPMAPAIDAIVVDCRLAQRA